MDSVARRKILVVAGGGGFAWECQQLILDLEKAGHDVLVAYPEVAHEMRDFYLSRNAFLFPPVSHRSGYRFQHLLALIANFRSALRYIRETRPDITVCVSSSGSFPFLCAAKVLGSKPVFIESMARTDTVCRTARMLLLLRVIPHVYVQWPEMEAEHPRYRFEGNVL